MMNFNQSPWYDDFDPENGYVQILFRPGQAVQARELTQIQSLIQNQISRFADNIFQEGSLVSNGQFTSVPCYYTRVNPNIEVRDIGDTVWSNVDTADRATVLADLVGEEFTSGGGVVGEIVAVDAASLSTDNFHAVGFNYLSDNLSASPGPVVANLLLTVTDVANGKEYRLTTKQAYSADSIPVTGRSFVVTSQSGVYYIDGFFVLTNPQRLLLSNTTTGADTDGGLAIPASVRKFDLPTRRVGFNLVDEIITISNDSSLGDPAFGSPNENAPGADRFKKSLVLAQKDFAQTSTISDTNSANFIEILRYESGVVTKRQQYPAYAVLGDTMARRTFDESGNYTVEPFDIQVREHTDVYGSGGSSALLAIGLEPGKAYIRGYEYENISTKFIGVEKARETDSASGKETNFRMGNYVIIGATDGIDEGITSGASILDTETHPNVSLQTLAGVTVATGLFRQISYHAADQFKIYLYNISNVSGQTFGDAAWLVGSGGTIGYIEETEGKDINGNTTLFNSTRDTLVVPLPVEESIETVTALSHEYQISLSATGSGNSVVFSIPGASGDPVEFKGVVGPSVDPSLLGRDYFLIDRTNNLFIDDFTGITVALNNSTECEVEFSSDITGDEFTLVSNADVDNDSSTAPYFATKTLGQTQASSVSLAYDSTLGATVANLARPDVYSILSVLGASDGADLSAAFELDDGQRDNFYDHSRLILTDQSLIGTNNVVNVTYRYFTRSGNGPFTVDSYPVGTQISGITFGYENIPSFTSEKTGKTISLRDAIDFRPTRGAGGSTYAGQIPNAAIAVEADFTHYLPRIDKIVLGTDQEFKVVKGVASLDPKIPNENPDDMVLYMLRLGSYTFGPEDVEVRHVDNKRFTMRDLGRIEDRLDQLEFYTSLSFLEQEVNSRTFLDSNGDVIPKTGILVDNFTGHQIGNVTNPDYLCSMDFEIGELRPAFVSELYGLDRSPDSSALVVGITASAESVSGVSARPDNKLYMLAHTSQRALGNSAYNTSVNANPTGRVDWLGHMFISPESDPWYSKETRPAVKVNKQGANDAYQFRRGSGDGPYGFNTQWLDWEVNWFGTQTLNKEVNRETELLKTRRIFDETFITNTSEINLRDNDIDNITIRELAGLSVNSRGRSSIARKSIPDSILKTVDERIVNTAVQPYTRSETIKLRAIGLKPSTSLYLYVDSELVQSGLVSDSDGSLELEFALPSLRSGSRVIRLIDNADNNITNATTLAEAIFRSSGAFSTRNEGSVSTRAAITRRSSVNDDSVITDGLRTNILGASAPKSVNSLSQQFTVDQVRYPNGMFAKSIDLSFASVPSSDSAVNIPVVVELRPIKSGLPHPSRVIPGSVAFKKGSQINTDGSVTNFEFEYPVYLEPGDYCVSIRTNSDEYTLRAGLLGSSVENTTTPNAPENAVKQPFVGPIFRPQNTGTVETDNTTALTFSLYRCKFDTDGGTLVLRNKTFATAFAYDAYRVNAKYLDPQRNGINWSIRTANNGSTSLNSASRIVPNETLLPAASLGRQNIQSGSNTLEVWATLNTNDDAVSPVIDAERTTFLAVRNDVRTTSSTTPANNGELSPQISDSSASEADISKSRYITKTIVLEDGMDSGDIRVFANVCQPGQSVVQVYAKTLPVDSNEEFDERNWVVLDAQTTFNSLNNNDFREVEFKPSIANKALLETFRVFAIKVVMHAKNGQEIPRVRDLRVISLV
jgi:hypothetical protein